MRQDLRYAVRMLVRTPWITLAVLLSLGLGIGANVTIFSWIRAVLLEPFPGVPDQSQLVMVTGRRHGGISTSLSYPDYVDMRDAGDVFEGGLIGITNYPGNQVSVGAERESEFAQQISAAIVSGNYFDALGVKPALGRTFRPEEDGAPLAHPVVVISHALWQQRFAGRAEVIGLPIKLNTRTFTIIGVAPRDFTGTFPMVIQDAWVPIAMEEWVGGNPNWLKNRGLRWMAAMGRLKPGVTVAQADAKIRAIASRLEADFPNDNRNRTAVAEPSWSTTFGAPGLMRPVLVVLIIVVVVVLMLACANIANMLLARALGRRREIAIRLSIGASRWRLLRQLLTESMLLAILGGVAGLAFARWAARILLTFIPPSSVQLGLNVPFDGYLLLVTAGATICTAVLIGLAPALQGTRPDVVATLKDEASSAGGGRRARLRSGLVVSQVTMTLLLLVPAGLFVRSLRQAQTIWPGFNTEHTLLAFYDLSQNGSAPETIAEFHRHVIERLESLPGVRSVTLASGVPLGPGGTGVSSVTIDGYAPVPNEDMNVPYNLVGPKYFETLEIPFREGRSLTAADRADSQKVAIVNDTMAARYWPGRSAIGGTVRTSTAAYQVVGIVRTGKYRQLSEQPTPYFYVPLLQNIRPYAAIHVRAHGDPAALGSAVTSELRRLDPNLPLTSIMTMRQWMDWPTIPQRLAGTLLTAFGALAMLLAAIGLYAVMSYAVSQRTREIGIRMALGARPGDVWRMVLRHGITLAAIGIAIGLGGALLLMPQLSRLLIGVGPRDVVTFVVVSASLSVTAVIASLIPAERASRVDPIIALRHL
jgi:putative ABC transport system permease protein